MSFTDLNHIKNTYNSANSDIVSEFYNPVLSESIKYDRISGFFSSTSLAIAARGIDKFIKNNGRMRLLCGAQLSDEDLNSINNSEDLKDLIDKNFLNDLNSIEDELIQNHVKLLGWMVANEYLEIKIGINKKSNGEYSNGMLHSKIGILYDKNEDSILFDGSVNETAYGWRNNIESLKVFFSWKNPEYMVEDKKDFENFWNNEDSSLDVFEVPEASKKQLIKIAPTSKEDVMKLLNDNKPKLRKYQSEAVNNWFNNDMRGIFSMATGTGKTFTALSCFDKLCKLKTKLLTVIACPQKHLISQWESNLSNFGFKGFVLHAYGDNQKWKSEFLSVIGDLISGIKKQVVVFTTFNTFSSDDFLNKINYYDEDILLIADEVHGVGSDEFREGLVENYNYRLGLSATPEIEDDFERNDFLYSYFGGIIYNYSLKKAIDNGFLTRYNYHPEFIDLNQEELEDYKRYSFLIARYIEPKSDKEFNLLQTNLRKRRNLINKAESKFTFLKSFLKDNKNKLKNTIIYCADNDQVTKVQEILDELDISNHKFTGNESTNKVNGMSQRDLILKLFSEEYYKVLVGIRCLDEGVDVPSTRITILMASTLNSRQHIQRRGRVLRKSPGKDTAEIYDLIVFPKIKNESDSVKKILENEKKRYDEYVKLADNFGECSMKLMNKWEEIK